MEDITFLEDYQYQLKLNELDRNLMEMERLGMEVANGLMAIHNATVVEQYQDKYGYTEHFQMLIGEEGLFDSAKEVLSSIISWLKKKLIQLASLIFNIVNGIVDILTSMVWAIVHVGKMNATKSPYKIPDVEEFFRIVYDMATKENRLGNDLSQVTTIGELASVLNDFLNEAYKKLDTGIATCRIETSYPRVDFCKYAQKLEYIINNSYVTMLNTMGKMIDTLQKSLNENDALTRTREKIADFIRRFPGARSLLLDTNKTKIYEHVNVSDESSFIAVLRIQ